MTEVKIRNGRCEINRNGSLADLTADTVMIFNSLIESTAKDFGLTNKGAQVMIFEMLNETRDMLSNAPCITIDKDAIEKLRKGRKEDE